MTPKVNKKIINRKNKFGSNQIYYLITASIIAIISLIIRYFAFDSPIMRDEAVYSILGNKAISGKTPYVDFFEMKPPLLYYCYGLGGLIFSWSSFGLRMLGFFLTLLNSSLLVIISRKFTSTSFSLLVGSLGLFLMQNIFNFSIETNSELFIISFLFTGLIFLIRKTPKRNLLNLFFAGFFIAGAALIKQTYALVGLGTVLFMIIEYARRDGFYKGTNLIKNIGMLALGALTIIILTFLPSVLSGALNDAIYWIYTYPSGYGSKINWSEGKEYMLIFGGWIFKYQLFTNSLLAISFFALLLNYKAKYYWYLLIPFVLLFMLILPGFRFYGHYWIPLYMFLPLALLGLKSLFEKYKIKASSLIISSLVLLVVCSDLARNGDIYFENDYSKNTALARSNNTQDVMFQMLDELKKEIQPHHTFGVFGIDANAYFYMEKMPPFDQIYPVMIARDNERNRISQGQALQSYKQANVDYAFYAIKGESWRSPDNFNDFLYNQTFSYLRTNYDPIFAYNYDEKKFYYARAGDQIDWYKANQVMTLKRK